MIRLIMAIMQCVAIYGSQKMANAFLPLVGMLFCTSEIQAQDMIYNGSLSELPNVKDLVHSTTAVKVVAIPAPGFMSMAKDEDTKLLTYDYEFLTPSETLGLPYFMINDKGYLGHGRFVFFNKAADTIIVILQADASSGMLNDTAIFTIKR